MKNCHFTDIKPNVGIAFIISSQGSVSNDPRCAHGYTAGCQTDNNSVLSPESVNTSILFEVSMLHKPVVESWSIVVSVSFVSNYIID